MADGAHFDPNDPTIVAANRWPLGTWLRVCHLDRCIEVQVRDRGAFGHAVDLSYAAFSQLAPPSAGVITVTVSRIPPPDSGPPHPPPVRALSVHWKPPRSFYSRDGPTSTS
jgi:rare lipoprotein A (peptidoglycan hydrolase)